MAFPRQEPSINSYRVLITALGEIQHRTAKPHIHISNLFPYQHTLFEAAISNAGKLMLVSISIFCKRFLYAIPTYSEMRGGKIYLICGTARTMSSNPDEYSVPPQAFQCFFGSDFQSVWEWEKKSWVGVVIGIFDVLLRFTASLFSYRVSARSASLGDRIPSLPCCGHRMS